MCSPGTENKQVVSFSGATPGRHNNMLEQHTNSSMLPQLWQYLPHVHPFFVEMVLTPWSSRSGDLLDYGREKNMKKQGDVLCVTQQSAINFEPMGTMGSPAYGQIGLGKENLFILHLGQKKGL